VKRGLRIVRGEKELLEKLAETIYVHAIPGGDFKKCCLRKGRYDGSLRNHYF